MAMEPHDSGENVDEQEERDTLGLSLNRILASKSHNESLSDWTLTVDRRVHWYGFGPVSFIGFSLNCVAIWVWNSKPIYHPVVFLFKALAVFDNAFLAFYNVWWLVKRGTTAEFVLQGFAFASQYMSVNTALLLTVCRCLSLHVPTSSTSSSSSCPPALSKALSRARVCVTLGGLVLFCALVKATERWVSYEAYTTRAKNAFNVIVAFLVLVFPVLLQTALAATLFRRQREAPTSKRCEGEAECGQKTAGVQDVAMAVEQCINVKSEEERGVTNSVVAIAITSFVVYPAPVIFNTYLLLSAARDLDMSASRVVLVLVQQLQLFNSAFRFAIYAFFIVRFRRLLQIKLASTHHYLYPQGRRSLSFESLDINVAATRRRVTAVAVEAGGEEGEREAGGEEGKSGGGHVLPASAGENKVLVGRPTRKTSTSL